MNDSKKLLVDYQKALKRLDEALAINADIDVVKAGCIQFFEFSFELAWKLIKAYAMQEGIESFSPKAALKAAYQLKLIDDELNWLKMLEARNLMSHTYDEERSLKIYDQLKTYNTLLNKLAETISNKVK